MVSFAFNTLIGQVTDMAMTNVGYKYYYLFIICNFTNAIFFYLFLPETAKLPLEEMNYLFTNAPYIVSSFRLLFGWNICTNEMKSRSPEQTKLAIKLGTLRIWREERRRLRRRASCTQMNIMK
jgi:hypothetical protein